MVVFHGWSTRGLHQPIVITIQDFGVVSQECGWGSTTEQQEWDVIVVKFGGLVFLSIFLRISANKEAAKNEQNKAKKLETKRSVLREFLFSLFNGKRNVW